MSTATPGDENPSQEEGRTHNGAQGMNVNGSESNPLHLPSQVSSTPHRHAHRSYASKETPSRGFSTPSSMASSTGFHTPSSTFATPSSMSSTYSTYDGTPLSFSYQDTVASLTPIRRSNSGRGISTPNGGGLSNSSKNHSHGNSSSSSNSGVRRSTPVKPSGSANFKYFVGLARDPQWTKERSSELMSLMMAQVSTGRDINAARRSTGETALHSLAETSEPWVIDLFLRLGADPNIKSSISKRTVLHKAAMNPNFKVTKMVWRQMLNTSTPSDPQSFDILSSPLLSPDIKGLTPLHIACLSGNILLLGYLLFDALETLIQRQKLNVDSNPSRASIGPLATMPTDNHKRNLLHALFEALPASLTSEQFSAVQEITEKLISLGVDRFAKDDKHYTPLKLVIEKFGRSGAERPLGVISVLLSGLSPKQVDKSIILMFKNDLGSKTASGLTASSSSISTTDISPSGSFSGTPGTNSNSEEVVWRDDWKPIQQAMQLPQYFPFLPLLISKVSQETLKYVDPNGRTIWHYMALMGSQQKVIDYYRREFPPGSAQKTELDAETGVFVPYTHAHVERIREQVDSCFEAILNRPDAAELCKPFNSVVSFFDRESQSPMHTAAKWNNIVALRRMSGTLGGPSEDKETCSKLQQSWKDKDGWTALHTAVHFNTVFALCELHQLDWNLVPEDNQGRTPYMLAVEEKKRMCAELLKAWGGAPEDATPSLIPTDSESSLQDYLSPRPFSGSESDLSGYLSETGSTASGSGSGSVSGSLPSSLVVEVNADTLTASSEAYGLGSNRSPSPTVASPGFLSPTSRRLLHTGSVDSLASAESASTAGVGSMDRPVSPIGRLRFQRFTEDEQPNENDEEDGEEEDEVEEIGEDELQGDEIRQQSVTATAFLSALSAAKDREEDAAEEIDRLRAQIQLLLEEQRVMQAELESKVGEIKQLENALNARPTIKEHEKLRERMERALSQAATAKNTVDDARSRIVSLELKVADLEEKEQQSIDPAIEEYKQSLQDSEEHIMLLKKQLQDVQRELQVTKDELERTSATESQISTQMRRQLDLARKEIAEYESYKISTAEALHSNEALVKQLTSQLEKLQQEAVDLQFASATANTRSESLYAELESLKAGNAQSDASQIESLSRSLEVYQSGLADTKRQLELSVARIHELESELNQLKADKEETNSMLKADTERSLQKSNEANLEISRALEESQTRERELKESFTSMESTMTELRSKFELQNTRLLEAQHQIELANQRELELRRESELKGSLSSLESSLAELKLKLESQHDLLLQTQQHHLSQVGDIDTDRLRLQEVTKTSWSTVEAAVTDLKSRLDSQYALLLETQKQYLTTQSTNEADASRFAALHSSLSSIETCMTDLKSKLESQSALLIESQAQLAFVNQRDSDVGINSIQLKEALSTVELSMAELKSSLSEIQQHISQPSERVLIEDSTGFELKDTLTTMETVLKDLKSRIESQNHLILETQLTTSPTARNSETDSSHLVPFKESLTSLESSVADLQSKLESQNAILLDAQQRLLLLNQSETGPSINLDELNQHLTSMESVMTELNSNLEKQTTLLLESQQRLPQTNEPTAAYDNHNVELKMALTSMESTMTELQSRLVEQQNSIQIQLTALNNGFETEHQNREAKLKESLEYLEASAAEMKVQFEDRQTKLQEAQHLISLAKERELESKQREIELKESVASLEASLAELKSKLEAQQSTLQQSQNTASIAEMLDSEHKRRESELQESLASMQKAVAELESKLETQQTSLHQAQTLLKLSEERETSLKKQNTRLESYLDEIQAQIQEIARHPAAPSNQPSAEIEQALEIANESIRNNVQLLQHIQEEATRQLASESERLQTALTTNTALQESILQRESDLAILKSKLEIMKDHGAQVVEESERHKLAAVEASKELHASKTMVQELKEQLKQREAAGTATDGSPRAVPDKALESLLRQIISEMSETTSSDTEKCLLQLEQLTSQLKVAELSAEGDKATMQEQFKLLKESLNSLIASTSVSHGRDVEDIAHSKATEEMKNQLSNTGNALRQLQQQHTQLIQQQQQIQQQHQAQLNQQLQDQLQLISATLRGVTLKSESKEIAGSGQSVGLTIYMTLMAAAVLGIFVMMLRGSHWQSDPAFYPS